jgi:hypothetical protein
MYISMYVIYVCNVYMRVMYVCGVKERWSDCTGVAILPIGDYGDPHGYRSLSRGARCEMMFTSPKTVCVL